jgi:plastocyanin
MPRQPLLAAACVALALALGACGDDKDSETGRGFGEDGAVVTTNPTPSLEEQKAGDVVEVGIEDIEFKPHDITVKVGQTIRWTNNEAVPHDVTATDGADFASKTLKKDQSFEYTPTQAGRIAYVCTIHNGQDGTITVTE